MRGGSLKLQTLFGGSQRVQKLLPDELAGGPRTPHPMRGSRFLEPELQERSNMPAARINISSFTLSAANKKARRMRGLFHLHALSSRRAPSDSCGLEHLVREPALRIRLGESGTLSFTVKHNSTSRSFCFSLWSHKKLPCNIPTSARISRPCTKRGRDSFSRIE
jgi:hypothetical protein